MAAANTLEKRIETGEEQSPRKTVVFYKGRNMRLITMSRLVLELSARLTVSNAQRSASPAVKGEAHLLLDWEEMEEVFRAFAESAIMKHRPPVTIRGMWLPIVTGGKHRGKGCVFVSISFAEKRSALNFGFPRNMGRDDTPRELSDLCGVIERHSGAVRLIKQQGKVILNIYLPVLERP